MAIGMGNVSASSINTEFGRSSSAAMSINSARNGSYGAINAASGRRPNAAGQSGLAYLSWRGYNHSASYPTIYVYESENYADVNIYVAINNNYGSEVLGGYWYFFGGTFNVATDRGITIRENDAIYAQWSHLGGWGDPNTYTTKNIVSTVRGAIYDASGPTGTTVSTTFYPFSGETLYIQGYN